MNGTSQILEYVGTLLSPSTSSTYSNQARAHSVCIFVFLSKKQKPKSNTGEEQKNESCSCIVSYIKMLFMHV